MLIQFYLVNSAHGCESVILAGTRYPALVQMRHTTTRARAPSRPAILVTSALSFNSDIFLRASTGIVLQRVLLSFYVQ